MLPEEKILLLSSFYTLSSEQLVTLSDLLSQNPDWKKITAASRFHSLAPLIVKHIFEGNLSNKLPVSAWQNILGVARIQADRRLRIISIFRELCSLFKEQNIDFILLKGLYLSDIYYTNPGLRPMQDIDFLVKSVDLERAVQILDHSGASRMIELQSEFINSFLQHIPPFVYKDVVIEIHTNLVASNESYNFTPDILWNNTINLEVQKLNISVFSPELNLIYLCVHLIRHVRTAKFRLIWFTDILQVFNRTGSLNISKFMLLSNEIKAEQTIAETFFLLNYFWNIEKNQRIPIKAIEPDPRVLRNFSNGLLRKQNPDEFYTLEAWKRIPGIKNKLRFFSGLAFPSVIFMKKKYSPRSPLLLILLYPYNALKVTFKGLKILLTR
jgi:hypothetical protein